MIHSFDDTIFLPVVHAESSEVLMPKCEWVGILADRSLSVEGFFLSLGFRDRVEVVAVARADQLIVLENAV